MTEQPNDPRPRPFQFSLLSLFVLTTVIIGLLVVWRARSSYNFLMRSDAEVLAVLLGVCAGFFLLEQRTKWKLFQYIPPLIFIYLTPVFLSNSGVIPTKSPVYDAIRSLLLPMVLVLLLIKVDVLAAVRVMGRGVFVMLAGTAGVVIGAPVGYFVVQSWLSPAGWKAYGTLAGSWIGGTGNMAAMEKMLNTGGTEYGLAVLADTGIYILWLPMLLFSKHLAGWFAGFTGVSQQRLAAMDAAAKELQQEEPPPKLQDYTYALFLAVAVAAISQAVAGRLPVREPLLTAGTWEILLVTTLGIGLSFTPAKRIPGTYPLAMALVYLFVARMGAVAELEGLAGQALPFLAGALIMILVHGAFCLAAAWLLRVDVHTAAIASAANIGGAASAPIVAAYHKESLVPASILMALIGYAVGNYAAYLAAVLCSFAAF